MKKRNVLLALALSCIMFTSCGKADNKTEENDASKPLKVAMFTEIDSLDPFNATAGDTKTIMDQVFDGLFDVDEDGNLVPDLCESYEISEDGLTYDFKLKEGVKFHNDKDFTADDDLELFEESLDYFNDCGFSTLVEEFELY